jgi:putative phosphonate catabolism associated alcohol dehydrogenase
MRRGWELSGGFATHVHLLEGTAIVAVPDDVPAAVLAPASCSTATVAAALEAASVIEPLDGSLLIVAGAGMRGLTAAAMATDAGARVVVSDPRADRRDRALAFGAVAVADPRSAADSPTGLGTALATAGGRAAAPTIALDFSGAASAVRSLLSVIDVGGVLVLAGSGSPGLDLTIAPEQFMRKLLTLRGVHTYAPQHLDTAVRYLADAYQRYPFADQVGATFPLAEVDAALAGSDHPRVAVRTTAP